MINATSSKEQPKISLHNQKEQPRDTVSCIKWLNDTSFFLSTWETELIGYTIFNSERDPCIKRVFYYKDEDDSSILSFALSMEDNNKLKIFYALGNGKVSYIIQNSDPHHQHSPKTLIYQKYPVLFMENTPLGLISVDMEENIFINDNNINTTLTPFSVTAAENTHIFSDNLNNQMSLLGCSIDFPYLMIFDMSQFIHVVDLSSKQFAKFTHPFTSSQVSSAAIRKRLHPPGGEIIVGSFDGCIIRISFELSAYNPVSFIWNYDASRAKFAHFSSLNENAPGKTKPRKCKYLFTVNAIQIPPNSTDMFKNEYISAGGEGRIIYWKKTANEILSDHTLKSVSALSISPSGNFLVSAIGYDWHKGSQNAQRYSPFIEVIILQNTKTPK